MEDESIRKKRRQASKTGKRRWHWTDQKGEKRQRGVTGGMVNQSPLEFHLAGVKAGVGGKRRRAGTAARFTSRRGTQEVGADNGERGE